MNGPVIPTATYRLQFNRDFTFADATRIVPYLSSLGVSHVYASPFLKARSGSPHGYDIVDHNTLNPEIGDAESFAHYTDALQRHGMGQLLDIVPNHMGVGGDDNRWWLDVLENGQSSSYATFFDIDWRPVNAYLQNKLLLPVLGDHYGSVLESGELKLAFEPARGAFCVHYYEHLLPLDPRSYAQILLHRAQALPQRLSAQRPAVDDYLSLARDFQVLPRHSDRSVAARRRRRENAALCKQRLAALCREQAGIVEWIQENVELYNGERVQPASFDPLHRLLQAQAYRLTYWQVAADEINYRRFFDVNDLAGIRMDNPEVFRDTHRLLGELIAADQVQGLRIDHPDGLTDPYAYYCQLQRLAATQSPESGPLAENGFYVLVEKILAGYERLPPDWPVAGTSGYEAAHLLNGLFVYPGSQKSMSRLYARIVEQSTDFDGLLYERKHLIMRSVLSSELTVLANLLSNIAQSDRRTRDFTYLGLRNALSEVVACFPVYRTYVTAERISDDDRRYIQWALAQAKKRSQAVDILIFDFIGGVLMREGCEQRAPKTQRKLIEFVRRFQQYTAPVMAKGMEDTTFYIYNRLVSLNDVGFDPRLYGVSMKAFHQENERRQCDWPGAMVTTSTHDSKRGEDVRARINVLSEIPDRWRHHLRRWMRLNRHKKRLVQDEPAPSANDEYLLYQTLVGTWPVNMAAADANGAFEQRIVDYMLKAIKEAKWHTSWINPNQEYETAMGDFIHAVLDVSQSNAFLSDFTEFQRDILRFGLYNSLSQVALKLTIPGVPDIYQGNELWAFSLVDPDNRGQVDYTLRRHSLAALEACQEAQTQLTEMLSNIGDGRAKMYLTWRLLQLRRAQPRLFAEGAYFPLPTVGPGADHICAFVRCWRGQCLIVVVARWYARLPAGEDGRLPVGEAAWGDSGVEIAGDIAGAYRDILNGARLRVGHPGEPAFCRAADLLALFPVAVLVKE